MNFPHFPMLPKVSNKSITSEAQHLKLATLQKLTQLKSVHQNLLSYCNFAIYCIYFFQNVKFGFA